ncbi:caspase family protein [Oculatella sp. LEGE 06141]|nr:caspase family protein [Oculatella sp. LEGE 06141]
MLKAAVLVGINQYEYVNPLFGCENDASLMFKLLSKQHDGTPNFNCRLLLSSETQLTTSELRRHAKELFSKPDLEIALFYFAGHGAKTDHGSFLVSQDGNFDAEGLLMSELITKANESSARERIIILDCCHAGAIDKFFSETQRISLEQGTSVLAACRDNETSAEKCGQGLFTTKICDALAGGAADVSGSVTVASIYAYVDEVLSLWEQRPLFKANLTKLTAIREAEPSVSKDKLRRLTDYFKTPDYKIQLDPSFEPDAEPQNPKNEAIFGDLQRFRGARLVQPDEEEHMYYAAMNSKSCSLTPLGRFYWERVKAGKI